MEDVLYVNWNRDVEMENVVVLDVTGRVVFEESVSHKKYSYQLDISELIKGIYFIQLSNTVEKGVAKFVKL